MNRQDIQKIEKQIEQEFETLKKGFKPDIDDNTPRSANHSDQ